MTAKPASFIRTLGCGLLDHHARVLPDPPLQELDAEIGGQQHE